MATTPSPDDSTDLYGTTGKKTKTGKGELPFSDRVSVGQGKDLKGIDFSRHNGEEEALLDPDLHVLFDGEGYSIDWLCDDRFTVSRGGKVGVVDGQNQIVVPFSYETVALAQKENRSYLCASGPDGCALYDLDGKVIYQSMEHTRLRLVDRMIVGNDWSGWVLSLDGCDLLGRGNRLWPEPVDRAEPAWGTGLFSVHAGSRYGLMDAYGRWIWSASDYDALDD